MHGIMPVFARHGAVPASARSLYSGDANVVAVPTENLR